MRTLSWSWAAAVVVFVSGCGGSTAIKGPPEVEEVVPSPAPPAPPSGAVTETVAAAAPLSPAPVEMAASSTAPSSGSRGTAPPAPSERPGLGTEWGEARVSRIHDVDFERSDDRHPFAVATIHYDDRRGAEALAAYHAWHGPRPYEPTAAGGAITVSIRGDDDEPLEGFASGDRTYVIGEAGERYSIVIVNHTSHRFEAVTTVDGLDVMNGRAGDLENRGYVLGAYESMTIDGFRQNQSRVAAFRFAKVADSYAAKTGRARNVGVIGMAFFDERGDAFARWSPSELHLRDTANPFPANEHRFAAPPPLPW
jgi:hypothetical protein